MMHSDAAEDQERLLLVKRLHRLGGDDGRGEHLVVADVQAQSA